MTSKKKSNIIYLDTSKQIKDSIEQKPVSDIFAQFDLSGVSFKGYYKVPIGVNQFELRPQIRHVEIIEFTPLILSKTIKFNETFNVGGWIGLLDNITTGAGASNLNRFIANNFVIPMTQWGTYTGYTGVVPFRTLNGSIFSAKEITVDIIGSGFTLGSYYIYLVGWKDL